MSDKQKESRPRNSSSGTVITRHSMKWALPVVASVLVAVLVVFLLVFIGKHTREQLLDSDRYTIGFSDIECTPPPTISRERFLSEVHYLAHPPDNVRLLDQHLEQQLRADFAMHPWVEKVEKVEITAARRQVVVQLAYRSPVLAVAQGGRTRAVDKHGVLLPASASIEGLPVFAGVARPPAGAEGTPWGDPAVHEAARHAVRRR